MKRVYFAGIFILFMLLVLIGFNYSMTNLGGSAVSDIQGDFSFFGAFAATVLVLTSYFLIKYVKEE